MTFFFFLIINIQKHQTKYDGQIFRIPFPSFLKARFQRLSNKVKCQSSFIVRALINIWIFSFLLYLALGNKTGLKIKLKNKKKQKKKKKKENNEAIQVFRDKCPLSILSSLSQGYVLVSAAVPVTQFVHSRRHMLFPDRCGNYLMATLKR